MGSLSSPIIGAAWKDMDFPLTRDKQGQTQKPDYDFTQMGLLYPQNDPTEISYLSRQINHDWRLGSNSGPHIHFYQTTATAPTFKINIRITENGAAPGGFTTYTTTGVVFTYVSGTLQQIATWDDLDWSGILTLSAIVDIQLYRDDNDVAGDVLAKSFDIHLDIDRVGSRQPFVK